MSSLLSKGPLKRLTAGPASSRAVVVVGALLLSTAVVAPFYLSRATRTAGGHRVWGFISTHDLMNFVPMMEQFDKVLRSGVLYPRWDPDFNLGYGTATANFYPPGVFYVTSLINAGVNDWAITLFVLSAMGLTASYFAFYLLSRTFYSRTASVVAALAYAALPYHQLDLYWRGAIPEFIGFALMPAILYFAFKLGSEGRLRYYAAVGLCHGLYLMSHLPVAYLFTYMLASYAVVWALGNRDIKIAVRIAGGIAISLLVSAIYWVPAALEGKYVYEWASDLFPYHKTYITMVPVLDAFDIHIQEAFNYNALLIIVTILILRVLPRSQVTQSEKRSPESDDRVAAHAQSQTTIWILLGILTPFMSTSFSIHLSKLIPKIQIAVPPFRWLAISCVFTSLLVAAAVDVLRTQRGAGATKKLAYASSLVAVVALNLWLTANGIILGALSNPTQQRPASFVDAGFTPRDSTRPEELTDTPAVVITPEGGAASVLQWLPTYREITVRVDQPSLIRMKTYNFPGWRARIDGQIVPMLSDKDGVQQVDVPTGVHTVEASFENTPPRTAGTVLSAVGLLVVFGLGLADGLKDRRVKRVTDEQSALGVAALEGQSVANGRSNLTSSITPRLKRRATAVLIVMVITTIIVMIIRRSDVANPGQGEAQPSGGSGQISGGYAGVGSDARLYLEGRDSVAVAVDEKASGELLAAIAGRDQTALEALTESGRVLKVDNNTRVRVLQAESGNTRVRILEGPNILKEGWVPERWLR
jgi:6-pyruvoyl-tetrahydropterin synthase related domain